MRTTTLILAGFLITGLATAFSEPQTTSDFAAVVQANFAQWDQNKDGELSKAEVEAQIADAKVTGKQAAALAAIITFQGGPVGKKKPLSSEFLLREAMPGLSKEVIPPFEARYRDALYRIEKVNRVLFGPGAPSLNEVRQGHIGDCFFVAVVGSIADRRPDTIRRWIEAEQEKTYRVRFPLGARSTVRTPTDGEIALTSFAGNQGLWINVLEKAFGSIMEAAFPNPTQTDPIESIAFGGTPIQTIRMMTAHEALFIAIRSPAQDPLNDAQIHKLKPQVRKVLLDCEKNKRIACAGSPKGGAPPGVTLQHAYSVLGFDEASEVLRLWNPHGNDFNPAGDSGMKNGFKTQHGRFEISLDDFVKTFCFLAYESETALTTD